MGGISNLLLLHTYASIHIHRVRRAVKVQRAIVGASLEDLLKKKQATKPKAAPDAVKYVYCLNR